MQKIVSYSSLLKGNLRYLRILIVLCCAYLSLKCSSDQFKAPKPTVESIPKVEITRLDSILHTSIQKNSEFSGFTTGMRCFFENIMGIPSDSVKPDIFKQITQYQGLVAALDSVYTRFPDLNSLQPELQSLLEYYHYYFPEFPIPELFSFCSEFQYAAISCGDSAIGIGLDMYLGSQFPFYQPLGYPFYMYQFFTPEYIPVDVAMSLLTNQFGQGFNTGDLLSAMLHGGKLLYGLDLFLPDMGDARKIKFTDVQLKWCQENAVETWKFFQGENILFSAVTIDQRKLIEPAPTVSGFPTDAPGNIGTWVGWQMVRAYMEKYPETTLLELFQLDSKHILSKANYKP